MKRPLAIAAIFFAACSVRADLVIVQNVDGMGQTGSMTISVGADKIRMDVNSQISTITDTNTGDVTTLMHAQRVYVVMTATTAKAMMASAQMASGISGTKGAPVGTGKTEKIDGYNASEYTFTSGNMKTVYWMTTEFPNGKLVTDALAKFRKGTLADMTKGLAPDTSSLPGVPIKTEVEINGQKITTELVSAKDQPVDPGQYQVPAGYTEMKMPPPH
jgi:hypothetical protein